MADELLQNRPGPNAQADAIAMILSNFRLALIVLFCLIAGAISGFVLAQKYAATAGGASSEAMSALAAQYLAKNDLQQAELLAFDAIAADPQSYIPYVLLGDIFSRREEFAAARSAYLKALQKLDGPRGHFRVLQLDDQLRQGERRILQKKLESLPKA